MSKDDNVKSILMVLRQIPKGRVATYGLVARLAGIPRNARQVGTILKSLPPNSKVPWFRVVNSNGEISPRKHRDTELFQRELLEKEKVVFNERGRISLSEYLWQL